MKFRITFKTPDTVDDTIKDLTFADSECDCGLCPDCKETEESKHEVIQGIKTLIERYVRYGELITVEFDTDTGACTVVPAR
jgi:hypothetical protein